MWKLVFSLLVVVGILELVSPTKMADTAFNQDKASGEQSESDSDQGPQNGQTGTTGNGATNLWLSGGHAVAPLLVLFLCLH
ncbi:hypothetical protein SprV_0602089200 [Sparganum proliferum]